MDLREPHAVSLALIDLSKAFNRVSHTLVVEDLFDMHVPPWLLKIIISYLTNRTMILSYRGTSSSSKALPGSSPQGAFLGIFLFIVKFNGASLRPSIQWNLPNLSCGTSHAKCPLPQCQRHSKETHALYIDDLAEAEAVNLKRQLVQDTSVRPAPLTYRERTNQMLPAAKSLLQKNLLKIESFAQRNQMKINQKKTHIMYFNQSLKYAFPPEYSFANGELLNVIEQTKLLGVYISSDLSWRYNTSKMTSKAMSRMWLLRRMKLLNLPSKVILEYYLKEIRPVLEYAVAVWHAGITVAQSQDIERAQKCALKIILGQQYLSYEYACNYFELDTLENRRLELCTNFAVKTFLGDRRRQFFDIPVNQKNTRKSIKTLVSEKSCRTKRCYEAPHNFLSRLVNKNYDRISNALRTKESMAS